jgi:hypothetical protein
MFFVSATANLLNYPLFFVLLIVIGVFGNIGKTVILGCFLVTSFLRCAWLWTRQVHPPNHTTVIPRSVFKVGAQQVLNFALFRSDIIFLSVFSKHQIFPFFDEKFLAMYLFISKFPEIVSGVSSVTGPVIYPLVIPRGRFDRSSILKFALKYLGLLVFLFFVLGMASMLFKKFWAGGIIETWFVVPFLIHSVLIFFVNVITYQMRSRGYLSGLVRNLTVACSAGLFFYSASILFGYPFVVALAVPAQLFLFVVLSIKLRQGEKEDLYGKA